MASAEGLPGTEETEAGIAQREKDWDTMVQGLRHRKSEGAAALDEGKGNTWDAAHGAASSSSRSSGSCDSDGEDERDLLPRELPPEPFWSRRWVWMALSILIGLALFGGVQLWMYTHPKPVTCTLEVMRPHKFKIDVTDFFSPRVSAAMQLVLSVKNNNLFRAMLLESCKLTLFEEGTGLKLGSASQGSLVMPAFTTTQVSVVLQDMAANLPADEQRRLAKLFLAKNALAFTLVAAASSRLPVKGSTPTLTSANATRRVDLSPLAKEPFFQRAAPVPVDDEGVVHDVPL